MSENLASDTDDSAGNTALLTERNTLSARVKDLEKQLADTRISSVAGVANGGMGDQNVQLSQLETENKTLRQQLCVCRLNYDIYLRESWSLLRATLDRLFWNTSEMYNVFVYIFIITFRIVSQLNMFTHMYVCWLVLFT